MSEPRKARTESSAAHAEETGQQAKLLDEATTAVHQQEAQERERVLASDLLLQRLIQLGRITDVLRELADIACTQMVDEPPLMTGTPSRLTRTTGMLARLEAATVIFESLGGPTLSKAESLAKEGRRANTPPGTILGDAMGVLDEITFLARSDDRLCLPKGDPSVGLWAR